MRGLRVRACVRVALQDGKVVMAGTVAVCLTSANICTCACDNSVTAIAAVI